MPKLSFEKLDLIPEGLREEAVQADGKFVVDVSSTKKFTEFRDNNIKLMQDQDTLKAKYAVATKIIGEDPSKFEADLTEMRTTAQKVKDGTLKTSDAIAAEVENRIKAKADEFEGQRREYGTKIAEVTTDRDGYKNKYQSAVRDNAITTAVLAAGSGINPQTLPDILGRAKDIYAVGADGALVPMRNGVIVYGADGATPMAPKEWLAKLVKEAPYFALHSSGGGANGGTGDASNLVGNPDFQKMPPAQRIAAARKAGLLK